MSFHLIKINTLYKQIILELVITDINVKLQQWLLPGLKNNWSFYPPETKVMLKLITNLDIFKIIFLFYPPFWIHIKISYCFPIILSIFSQVHLLLIILTFFTFQLQYFKLLIFKTMQTRIIYGKRKHSEISVKDLQSPLYKKTLNQPVKISSIHHFKANTKIGSELCGNSNNSMNLFDSGKLESFDKLYEFDDICYNKYQLSDFKNLQEINLYELPTDYHL